MCIGRTVFSKTFHNFRTVEIITDVGDVFENDYYNVLSLNDVIFTVMAAYESIRMNIEPQSLITEVDTYPKP